MVEKDDHRRAMALKTAIKDEFALMEIARLPKEIRENYKLLKEAFLKANDKNKDDRYRRFLVDTQKQRHNEHVNEYYRI